MKGKLSVLTCDNFPETCAKEQSCLFFMIVLFVNEKKVTLEEVWCNTLDLLNLSLWSWLRHLCVITPHVSSPGFIEIDQLVIDVCQVYILMEFIRKIQWLAYILWLICWTLVYF